MKDRSNSTEFLLPTGKGFSLEPVKWERLSDEEKLLYLEQLILAMITATDRWEKALNNKNGDPIEMSSERGLHFPSYDKIYCINNFMKKFKERKKMRK